MSESTALRQLLAQFVIEVDKAGALAKGNAAVDALKKRLEELQAEARPTARAVNDALSSIGAKAGQLASRNLQAIGAQGLVGSGRASGDAFLGAGLSTGKVAQFGPTREAFDASRKAAEAYAGTLRGKLAGAVQAARSQFGLFGRSVQTLAPQAAQFAGQAGLGGLSTALGALASPAAAAAAGVGAVVAAIAIGVRQVNQLGNIGEAAAKLGVTAEEFQRLNVLAEQNSSSVGALGAAFRTLANNAVQPTKDAAKAFVELGVSTRKEDGAFKSRQDLFFETAGALADIQDETVRAQKAQELYGRSALELLPLLSQGRGALEQQRTELMKLPVVSGRAAAAADMLADRWAGTQQRITAAWGPIVEGTFVPVLSTLTDMVDALIDGFGKWADRTKIFDTFGQIIKTWMTPMRLAFDLVMGIGDEGAPAIDLVTKAVGKLGLAFSTLMNLPFLLAQDFQVYLAGGDSVIGRAISALQQAFTLAWSAVKDAGIRALDDVVTHAKDVGLEIVRAITPDFLESSLGIPAAAMQAAPPSIPLPPMPLAGYGAGAAGASGTNIQANGDRIVHINMTPGSSPQAVAGAVGGALEEDRNKLVASYGGFL